MKNFTNFFLATLLLLLVAISAFAYDFSAVNNGKTLYYNIKSSSSPYTVEVTSSSNYSGLSGSLVIPESVEYNSITYSVTSIGERAFYCCSGLTSVTIPNSVTSIGNSAFENCSGLTGELTIPNSVTSIGYSVFSACSGLTGELTIPNSVTSIGSYAFNACSGLTSVTIGNSVTSIANYAFQDCSSLTTVNYNATNCTTMGSSSSPVFSNCTSLSTLNIGENVTNIPDAAFYNCSRLTEIILPNSVTRIGSYAFYGCSGFTSLTIGSSVTNIGRRAFDYCSGLTTLNFNATNCTIMGDSNGSIFLYCSALSTLNIGSNVTNIPDCAFKYIRTLTTVTIPNSVTSIGDHAFYGCSGLTSFTIPNSVTHIGVGIFSECTSLESVIIGNSLDTISKGAFKGCTGLSEITIPNTVTCVDQGVFEGCTGLSEITIPNTVTYIGPEAFKNCSGLTSFTMPNSITSIESYTFYECSAITSFTIPNSVTSIGSYAFCGCSGLRDVTIPSSVTRIDNYAFYYCNMLSDIYVKRATPPSIQNTTFLTYIATLWVPCGSATRYGNAGGWSSFRTIRENLSYTLNVSSANPQQGTASIILHPDCDNSSAIIVASPNEGYLFSHWNDGNTDNPRTINVTADVEYTAYFGALRTITVLSADETMGTASGGGVYAEGSLVEISANSNEHYHFVQWNDGNRSNPRAITVVSDSTFTATFAIDQHTITVESADETMGSASESGEYDYGAEIQILATANEHYHFVQWDDGSTDNPRTITVASDSTFTANFAIDQHTITVESADVEMGTVSEGGTYDYGTEIQISATANDEYGFVAWNDGNTDNPRTITVTEDATYTAAFGILHTITVMSADETMGTVIGDGEYAEGSTIQITAVPNEHYHFVQWIVEENPTRDIITDNPLVITITGDVTYTAVFAIDQHTITVESNSEAMGTVSEGGTYDYGTEIQISATANEHYHFVQWNDGNTDNPRTITVTEDAIYTASFAIDRFRIMVLSADISMGNVIGGGTYDYGSERQIFAVAYNGYQFASWDDGNTDSPRTITVTGEATYTAEFIPATGIEENAALNIALFPNPANDILNISSSETISEIEIVNTLGQVVKRIEVNADNAVCDVEELTSGVYVVRIHTEGTVVSQRKFVKE